MGGKSSKGYVKNGWGEANETVKVVSQISERASHPNHATIMRVKDYDHTEDDNTMTREEWIRLNK